MVRFGLRQMRLGAAAPLSRAIVLTGLLSGCSMSEEIKRIDRTREAELRQESAVSTNLTGEQVFIRSCNTCHPGGRAGMGPALEGLDKKFPDDEALKSFLRAGKGMMPAQPREVVNDVELANLVAYLRTLNVPEK